MSEPKLKDFFLLMVLSEGQSADTRLESEKTSYPNGHHAFLSVYSQLGQGRLEEGVRVVPIDHLSFALLGFGCRGHRDGG